MAWIELHDTARDHPKIKKLARDLGIAPYSALGLISALWLWALRMAPDGNLSSFEDDDVEIEIGWDGDPGTFVASAIDRRLLDRVDGHLEIHDWGDYSGSLKAASRMRALRARKKASSDNSDERLRNSDERLRHVTQTDRQTDRPINSSESSVDDVRRVFDHWVKLHWSGKGPQPKLDPKRRALISRQTKHFTAEQLCSAIDGAKLSPWHMGDNPNGTLYNGLQTILRDSETIERHITRATGGNSNGNADPDLERLRAEWKELDLEAREGSPSRDRQDKMTKRQKEIQHEIEHIKARRNSNADAYPTA